MHDANRAGQIELDRRVLLDGQYNTRDQKDRLFAVFKCVRVLLDEKQGNQRFPVAK